MIPRAFAVLSSRPHEGEFRLGIGRSGVAMGERGTARGLVSSTPDGAITN